MTVAHHNREPLIIWRFSDGRAGHDTQSRGLVQAITRLTGTDCHEIQPLSAVQSLSGWFLQRFPPGRELPDPVLLVGAGHGTHLPMLTARHARGGSIIVLMKPSLPVSWFDYSLVPAHDRVADHPKIITTLGALNTVTPAARPDPERGLILIGGESRHYGWDGTGLLRQVTAVLETGGHWIITDSPRTPDATREQLAQLRNVRARYMPWRESGPGWLAEQLQQAGTVWVSADSMSMIYEALTAGAAVGVLQVPVKTAGRVSRAIGDLAENGQVTRFEDWSGGRPLTPPRQPLHEADRCARLLLDRLGRSG